MTQQTRLLLDQKLTFIRKHRTLISAIFQLFFAIWYLYGLIDKEWNKEGKATPTSKKNRKSRKAANTK
jgi:hypothetical protein